MKTSTSIAILLCSAFLSINAQGLEPIISFEDNSESYCMQICFDGKCFYTVNGGVKDVGKITAYSINGIFLQSYPLPLDMRSIFYHTRNKCFYVCTTDKKLFKIIDINAGTYELVYENLYDNKQISLTIDPNGKFLYAFDNGTLSIYKFKTGTLVRTLSGLKCGEGNRKGAATVAIDRKKNIYTWDSDTKTVFVYDKNGKFLISHKLKYGDFGYSLSFAKEMFFVSNSPKNKKGTWFGYKL
ncbi:hypothetical protein E9993_19960 [Labilibacter sediminis]|nr:hypothetical protein E9993_19960 [Labilibacter sediminis]